MTLLGVHTVHELRNLWDGYSYELQSMNASLANAWTTWQQKDPQGFAAWETAYAKVSQAVADLGSRVDTLIASATLPGATGEDLTPAVDGEGDAFNALLAAFATGDATGPTTPGPGGFDDLDARFRQGPAASFAPTYAGMPQPDAPDVDLSVYQFTDTALKQVEQVVQSATSTTTVLAIGLLLGIGLVVAIRR